VFEHREYARERIAQFAARLPVFGTPVALSLELSGPVERGERAGTYRQAELGERLGPLFATFWLRGSGVVPEGAHLFLDFGGEATLWVDGQPAESLSSGPRQARLSVPVPSGEQVFELELACNDAFGFGESGQGLAARFELRRCDVAPVDADAWRTFHDVSFLLALEDVAEPEWAGELLAQLHAFTVDGDRGHLDRLLARGSNAIHRTSAIGHAHLDTAWLWPLEETYRKLIRTTTAQLRLLDDYSAHVFAHSQAQHYAWLRARDPGLYARVKAAIAAGRWIPVGGTWIACSRGARTRSTRSRRSATPTSTQRGCGRWRRPTASWSGPRPRSCGCSTPTPTTSSPTRRRSTTRGCGRATRSCTPG
jgi:alpha-mannosidase